MRRSSSLALALGLVALTGCGGAGNDRAEPAPLPHSCPPFLGGSVSDPVVQPADGATAVSTGIGSVTVPAVAGLAGATLLLNVNGPPFVLTGGTFTPSGTSTLAATVPALAPHSTYFLQSNVLLSAGTGPLGCDVVRAYLMGSFTTQ